MDCSGVHVAVSEMNDRICVLSYADDGSLVGRVGDAASGLLNRPCGIKLLAEWPVADHGNTLANLSVRVR